MVMVDSAAGRRKAGTPKVVRNSRPKRSPRVKDVAGSMSEAPGPTRWDEDGEARVWGKAALVASAISSAGIGVLGKMDNSAGTAAVDAA